MGDGVVARVCIDSPLPHLDRLFDYAVPEALRPVVAVGTRVRVPFAGRLISAIVCDLSTDSAYDGRLLAIRSAAPLPSTTPAGIELARVVARRYGGSLWDVLRLAIPPRVLSVERRWIAKEETSLRSRSTIPSDAPGRGVDVTPGERVVWEALPDPARRSLPVDALVSTVLAVADGRGGVIVVVPDARAVDALAAGFEAAGLARWNSRRSEGNLAIIRAEDGPATRYDNYLAAMTGTTPIVLGTRATAFQPVPRLAGMIVWDDGNPALLDPHAPYPHARTVAVLRASGDDVTRRPTLVFGSWAPSIEVAALASHGWARWVTPSRDETRATTPIVEVMTDTRRAAEGGRGRHWMPGAAWSAVSGALDRGTVAIVVPRSGYVGAVACARCREWAACRDCGAPLAVAGRGADPTCVECGRIHSDWHCSECHGARLSEVLQGVERVAEQIRRMAPNVVVSVSSAATGVIEDGGVNEGIVVATPGALPAVLDGYASAVIVGADSGLGRSGTEVDAVRRWLGVAALVRPRSSLGRVILIGELAPDARRALETWSPGGLARAASAERETLGLPPHRRLIRLDGPSDLLRRVAEMTVEGVALASRSDVTAVGGGLASIAYLCPRGIAPQAIDGIREIQREASLGDLGELHMRVDGSLSLRD